LKSSLFDRRVYFNATVFRADYRGFQTSVTSFLPDGTFLTFLNSVGHLRTQGVELDGVARVTKNLRLNGAFAYTDATVHRLPNGPCFNGQATTASTASPSSARQVATRRPAPTAASRTCTASA
jgi:iron complex outermembrane receptor protein